MTDIARYSQLVHRLAEARIAGDEDLAEEVEEEITLVAMRLADSGAGAHWRNDLAAIVNRDLEAYYNFHRRHPTPPPTN